MASEEPPEPQPAPKVEAPSPSKTPETINSKPDTSRKTSKSSQRWISQSWRTRTNLEEVSIDSRSFKHAHIIRRPRPLQYYKPDTDSASPQTQPLISRTDRRNEDGEERSTDNLLRQLLRIDLFVDLVWVGIIANLSHTFSTLAFSDSGVRPGVAFLEFYLLFIPIWRVWDRLRAFGSNFYNDDVFQRQFVCWILILAVIYGINAPYAFNPTGEGDSLTLLISVYLVTRASFTMAHGVQALFMPFLRRQFLYILVTTFITAALWIPAIWVPYPQKIALLVLASVLEYPIDMLLSTPIGAKLITGGWKRMTHIDHFIERHEGFFIIILGEGVFRLVEGSPSGMGLNSGTGTAISILLLYYAIHWLYFNGDQSKFYVHALRRTWWRPILWQMSHVIMFGALLLLASSTLFLVEHHNDGINHSSHAARASEPSTHSSSKEIVPYEYVRYALWTASISLAASLFCMTHIAFLNRTLDEPRTLVVNSRYLRLAPRLIVIILMACLPAFKGVGPNLWCLAAVLMLYALFFWEWIAGLERNWKFFEPKDE